MATNTTRRLAINGLISFFMLFSAWYSATHRVEFAQMGFPEYFRIELTTAKIVGAVLLLVPASPSRVREWIYAAFAVVLVSAAIAKCATGYPLLGVAEPLFTLAIMVGLVRYLDRLDRPA